MERTKYLRLYRDLPVRLRDANLALAQQEIP